MALWQHYEIIIEHQSPKSIFLCISSVVCSSFSITGSSSSGAIFSKQLKHFSLSGRGPQRQHSQNTKHDITNRILPTATATIQTISKIVPRVSSPSSSSSSSEDSELPIKHIL